MKYRTFRNLVFTGGIVVAAGLAFLVVRGRARAPDDAGQPQTTVAQSGEPSLPEQPVVPDPRSSGAPEMVRPGPSSDGSHPPSALDAGSPGALRPVDEQIIAAVRAGISGAKVKDALPGRPEKVSLYRDAGHLAVNRVKIDLDRDGRWDEKWTLEGDEVKRLVAPADDERYTREYRLRGGRWTAKER